MTKYQNGIRKLKRTRYVLITIIALQLVFSSCTRKPAQSFSFAFYNVENLFDTIDDPHIRDNSHLPDSDIPWTSERYRHKLDNLSKVMSAVDTGGYPSLFGLCEVENIDVLLDLINHPSMNKAGYRILHKDSPDERGIDVALLYQANVYAPAETQYIQVIFPDDPNNKTRDILYSKGVVYGKDTLHIFINHWVSRWGGQEKTEPHRRFIGALLKTVTDSIFATQPNANIIVSGDLNDNPDDLSIAKDLGAQSPAKPLNKNSLYNLSLNKFEQGEGSLYYKSWDMFDQVLVSSSILDGKNGIKVDSEDQLVIKHDWMLYHPEKGPARPSRTAARSYYGGYSDHLPVLIKLTSK